MRKQTVFNQESLPGDWYIYRAGNLAKSCRTREAAIKWAQAEMRLWKEQGAPRVPEYKVHYNFSKEPAEIVSL